MHRFIKIVGIYILSLFLVTLSVSLFVQASDTVFAKAAVSAMQTEQGVLIILVQPNSPAAKASLARGDIVLKINDIEVNKVEDLNAALADMKVGDTVTLTVLHGDATGEVKIVLDERMYFPWLGIVPELRGLPDLGLLPAYGKVPGIEGIIPDGVKVVTPTLVTEVLIVAKDSPAEIAGLREGDRIVSIDAEFLSPESRLAERIATYKPGATIVLTVRRRSAESTVTEVTVTLGENPENEAAPYLGIRYALRIVLGDTASKVELASDHSRFFNQGLPHRQLDQFRSGSPDFEHITPPPIERAAPPLMPGFPHPPMFGFDKKDQHGGDVMPPGGAPGERPEFFSPEVEVDDI